MRVHHGPVKCALHKNIMVAQVTHTKVTQIYYLSLCQPGRGCEHVHQMNSRAEGSGKYRLRGKLALQLNVMFSWR